MSKGNGNDVYHHSNIGPHFLDAGLKLYNKMNSDNGSWCYTCYDDNNHL